VEVAIQSPIDGSYQGHEGLTEFMTEFWGQFGTFRTELEECIPVGDDVVLGVQYHGTGRGSGVGVEMPNWQVCTIRAGRVFRWRNFRTRAEALEAVGLLE
jgi:ketosteroid isomerase-like protein